MIPPPGGGLVEPPAGSAANAWRGALLRTGLLVGVVLLLFHQSVASMAAIWWRSETFTHGFFVAPASLLVVWKLRRRVAPIAPRVEPRAIFAVALTGAGWAVAHIAGIQGIEQVAFVALLVAVVVGSIGAEAARRLAFPLAFLFLMVPLGEVFVPFLIEVTARFTFAALHATGIPVVRDGDMIRIPNGNWRVVEACSGLRYLIASFTLGWFFAWWTFSVWRRRAVFLGLSIVVPIAANAIRAYLIIMLGYLSDMKLAVGVDHYLYGWVFFSIVMALLFWSGRWWAERVGDRGMSFEPDAADAADVPADEPSGAPAGRPARPLPVVAGLVAAAAVWPLYAATLDAGVDTKGVTLAAPSPAGGWQPIDAAAPPWTPDFGGLDAARNDAFGAGDSLVWLYVGFFADQRQDHELINTQNQLVSTRNRVWRRVSSARRAATPRPAAGPPLDVTESVVHSANQDLMVWSWYWIDGRATADPFEAKWRGAEARLLRRSDAAAIVAAYAPMDVDSSAARGRLAAFARDMLPSIDSSLRAAARRAPGGATPP